MKKNTGFTLMELMIVIAIIMILSGAIIARIGTGGEKAKIAKATAEMNEIAAACRAIRLDTGLWPKHDIDLLRPPTNNGWGEDGVTVALNLNLWKGPYLETTLTNALPLDPWGTNPYVLSSPGGAGSNIYVNCSQSFANNSVLVHRF